MDDSFTLNSGIFLPLFSFSSVVDTDLGLLNYVFKEFRNEKYFDLNILDYNELINKVYYRSFENPLYVIMKEPDNEEHKEFLDECYYEFIETKEKEILDYSLSTQIMELIHLYASQGIKSTIMYFSDEQFNFMDRFVQFEGLNVLSIEDVVETASTDFSQFYLKYISEMYFLRDVRDRTIYVSNCGLNLNESRDDLKESEILEDMIMSNNQINIIDMYRQDIIGKDIYKYGVQ